ncbi:PAS domain-containing protein [Pigmentibacter sp. JX0631]|uniref:helix-turn-helix transcriptional regulator n=1 Tax=Pigmentibacter sp. JX0631 TaxID=2976982 RepID=UPI002468D996|nr:PAS domain-containing protein [Pigmentibacter sp. JX0631]WGL60248.1 PAS domain-containing protein [Pigmentibacter sp. JX0631]
MLENYINISKSLEKLFTPYLEIVIHDLKLKKITYIANNISNRKIGEDSNLSDIKFDNSQNIIGPYEKINYDGKVLKCISIVLNDANQNYLMCMNFDCSFLVNVRNFIDIFFNKGSFDKNAAVLFKDDWQEKIHIYLNNTLLKMKKDIKSLTKEEKKQIIIDLEKNGAFLAKNSKEYIAKILNLSRASVYNYLHD